MPNQRNLYQLKNLLRDELSLDLDEHALRETQRGLVCNFLGLWLNSAFQPIIDATSGKPFADEALLRASTAGDSAVSVLHAFNLADADGKLVEFDRLLRTLHLLNHLNTPLSNELLFLNVHPNVLATVQNHGATFEHILGFYGVSPSRVVIEIVENAVEDERQLIRAVKNYHDHGYKIAIDDYGSGNSNLLRVFELQPEFVKLDGELIRQAEHKPALQRVIRGLVDMFHDSGAQVVVEGIETQPQLDIARNAGADLLQGYHLGRPAFPAERGETVGAEVEAVV